VLTLDYYRGQFSDEWFYPRSPHCDPDAVEANRQLIEAFAARLQLRPDGGHPDRTPAQRHLVDEAVPLSVLYGQLLTCLHCAAPDDSHSLTGVLLQIDRYLSEVGDAQCAVYLMGTDTGHSTRRRGVDERDRILNLFQGAYPSMPRAVQGTIYPGDREIRSARGITVQVHRLTITQGDSSHVLNPDVPTVAVWVPSEMGSSWIVQEEQHDAG
jgi:hypothetical protein